MPRDDSRARSSSATPRRVSSLTGSPAALRGESWILVAGAALLTALWVARGRGEAPVAIDFASALEKERDFLVHKLADYERHEQEITETRREIPLDLAEHGSETEDARLTEQLAELAARRLRAIEHALEREQRGELATCEECGGSIPEARLRALPGTTACIRCAREAEKNR